MKRKEFLTGMAAAGTMAGLGGCLPSSHPKKNKKQGLKDETGRELYTESFRLSSRNRSGIALGGIGTGSIELRKNGQFYNWTIMNNQPFGAGPVFEIPQYPRNGWEDSLLFFLVRYQPEGQEAKIKLLQLPESLEQGGMESIEYYFPWMEPVSEIEYSGRFPFIKMRFSDPDMPFLVHLEAFSPFIPHDIKNSSLPGIFFNFSIEATGSENTDVMLLGTLRNLTAYDTKDKFFTSALRKEKDLVYFDLSAGGTNEASSSYGHMGLASLSADSSWYLGWEHRHPYYEKLLVEKELARIDDTEGRNITDTKTGIKAGRIGGRTADQRHFSSIALSKNLSPGDVLNHSFIMSWYFPNNYGSYNGSGSEDPCKPYNGGQIITENQGHYYQNFFQSAGDVAMYMADNKGILREKSLGFQKDFYASDLPVFVLDQINSHLNTFITSSRLTKDGTFAIREGMTSDKSWGPMATTDVSLYGSLPVLFLFPELQKSTMRAHKAVQTEKGEIAHGLGLDLGMTQNGTWGVYHRLDLPGQFVQMCLRDFFYTNDREFLDEVWPAVKKAIHYVLEYRNDLGNQMPYMKGIECSYDNFPMFGMAAYIQSQWLCAMASAAKAADIAGDQETADLCRSIFEKGSQLMEEKLWNGSYYRLYNDEGGLTKGDKSEGILTDQIIGQWVAHFTGLGYLFKEDHVKSSLKNILKYSYKKDFGLRNCTWPEHPDRFPIHESDLWVDQANTPWTGVELAFASFLIYEGFVNEGLEVIKTVDDRYRKAGLYFDHQEFGGHYYRPMSAWGIMNAILGLSINQDEFVFAPRIQKDTFRIFFSTAGGTAHFEKKAGGWRISVLTGKLRFRSLTLPYGQEVLVNGSKPNPEISYQKGLKGNTFIFSKPIEIEAGAVLNVD